MNMLAMAAAMLAAPVQAQTPAPAQPASAMAAPVDPARLALATTTIDRVWPLGTYARMMNGTMEQMMDGIMASMFEMKPGDLVPGADGADARKELGNKTMRQLMMGSDPHFEERTRLSNRVMMNELVPLMSRMEPQIRVGLSRAYARKFDAAQLGDMNAFFATPSGAAYARESLLLMVDPEFIKVMSDFMPVMIREMPAIVKKMSAATAHLPLPSKKAAGAKTRR